jgi:uncharacterized membrane protein YecN with MAPEG domain
LDAAKNEEGFGMKDLVKFLTYFILIMPCMLMFNGGTGWWLNLLGAAYFFCLVAVAMGSEDTLKKWLNAIERYEDKLNGR